MRINQIEEARKHQQEFARQFINAQELERQRIAAELHDSIGQDLLIIKNMALLGLNHQTNKQNTREHFEEISETATRALDETRLIARNLRPQHLQRFGLTQTLTSMFEQIQSVTEINFQTRTDNIDSIFDSSDEISVFRIFQESINNILKHSDAKNALIEVRKLPYSVKITIQDNGKGFEINSLSNSEIAGFGLTSIEQRVNILGGSIKINSQIGVGTQISIIIPTKNVR